MKFLLIAISGLGLSLSSPASAADPKTATSPGAHDVEAIDRTAKVAYEEGHYAFCTKPQRPLGHRQEALCSLAAEVDGCEGLLKVCEAGQLPKDTSWLERLVKWAGPVAKGLLYLLVLAIIIAVAIPVVRAILRLRRDRKITASPKEDPNRAILIDDKPIAAAEISDAETALRLADAHRARGELDLALGLYLAASLAALDRRGAIRIARHRTNGEYVRGCEEEASRPPLREIVREVDKVEFGGNAPTNEGVLRVASRAQAIVRTTTAAIVIVVAALGCSAPGQSADPAGDELPMEVLRRNGLRASRLGSSLATMPIPDDGNEGAPIVIVDVDRVPLEEEAQAHMMRWVEAGGVLVLFGHIESWPSELHPKREHASTRDLVVRTPDPNGGLEDMDSEDIEQSIGAPIEITGARTARADAFSWKESLPADKAESLGFLGEKTYASKRRVGKGIILAVANDDLFTNLGVLPRHNAAALVTLVRSVTHDPMRKVSTGAGGVSTLGDVRIARAEDGIPPPANPFAALVAAGLGKGAWHALVAALLLFLAYGIRHARPRPGEKKTRRAFAEHVEATGAFYGRARAHAHALASYGRFVELRLRESVPRGADPVTFLASRSGVDVERVTELYARATRAKAGDALRGDELTVIEELRRMMEKTLSK